MRIVAALGGNALLKRGEPVTAERLRANVRRAASSLAELVREGHQLVITHGNGPQIGRRALQPAAGPSGGAWSLDILGAESEGMLGFMIEQELGNDLANGALIATLLTQVRVDANDQAFRRPTKPIGPACDEQIGGLAAEHDSNIVADPSNWRRAVAAPEPLEILETNVISMLVERGVTVICAGGIPVVQREAGDLIGVQAIIDKDRASALLARQLKADKLLLLTDVDAVYLDFGGPNARAIATTDAAAIANTKFAAGSIGPKIEAATDFSSATGNPAGIGRIDDAAAIVRGTAGTRIVMTSAGVTLWPRPAGRAHQ